jgi:SAM-dependent methyltransferase
MHLRRWKYKAALQRWLSAIPAGHRLNYALQRATGGLPLSLPEIERSVESAEKHLSVLEEFGEEGPTSAALFEFGAGWDLHMPLAFAALGAGVQTVVDIRPLLKPNLVFDVATRMAGTLQDDAHRTDPERLGALSHPPMRRRLPAGGSSRPMGRWLESLSIEYRAPADARQTGIPSNAVDLVTSTNTLEHIPPVEIRSIMSELRRILAPGGVASFKIDYQDHWSYFDPSISVYNFLRYDDASWSKYSPALHYQNRLRHDDYLSLFEESGFTILRADETGPTTEDLEVLAGLPIADDYSGQPAARLGVRGGWIALRVT